MNSGFDGFVLEGSRGSNAAPKVRFTERWQVPLDIEVISPAAVAEEGSAAVVTRTTHGWIAYLARHSEVLAQPSSFAMRISVGSQGHPRPD